MTFSLGKFPNLHYICNLRAKAGVAAWSVPADCRKNYTKRMDLFDRISEDIKKAMLAREKVRLEALRGIKKEFLEAKTAKGANGVLTDETAIRIMTKMVKQRRESARIYEENNRPELAAGELEEAAVIEEYLPAQLSPEDLHREIGALIEQTGAKGPRDMGKVMGVATKALAGRAEGSAISNVVKEMLAAMPQQ